MNTDTFEMRIQELLDCRAPLASDPELLAAAHDSEELRSILASYVALFDGVKQLPPPIPDNAITQRVLAELAAGPAEPAVLPMPDMRQWRLGAAAAILLATGASLWMWNERDQSPKVALAPSLNEKNETVALPAPPVIAAPGDESVGVVAIEPVPTAGPREQKVLEIGLQYAAIARQAMIALSDLAVLEPTLAATSPPSEAEPTNSEPAPTADASLVDRLGVGLTPLASSTAGAFDFLFEVLPQSEAEF
ncbi:MAG: hypothetical protein K1X71_16100 [Pirellulales bacterium]|nr:hypothetical protein [Pirellulales bacterium]